MTLEQKINKILGIDEYIGNVPVELWLWTSPSPSNYVPKPHSTNPYGSTIHKEIDGLIRKASPVECATSPSQYIRECRKWYDKHDKIDWNY